MEISPFSYVLLAAYSFFFGIILGGVYDALRAVRLVLGARPSGRFGDIKLPLINRSPYPERESGRENALVMTISIVGDFLYVLGCGTMVVMIAFVYNSGRVRAVIFAGVALGMILYFLTVGKITVIILEAVAFAFRSAMLYIWVWITSLCKRIKKIKKKGAKNERKKSKNKSC